MSKYLENKTVVLRPNPRKNGMINDPKHIGYFRYNGTTENFMLPADDHNGGLIEIFEDAKEREFFAKELGIPTEELNVRRKENYFHSFQVRVLKDEVFMSKGYHLNLNDPIDVLKYKVLIKSKSVAPSFDKRFYSGAYTYYLVEKDYKDTRDLNALNQEAEVWEKYNDMKDSSTKMYEFLFLYWLKAKNTTTAIKSAPPKDATLDYCKIKINAIIKADKKGFLEIFKSPSLKEELMVYQAIEQGFIDYDGRKFLDANKAEIGRTMEDVLHYYSNPINSKEKLKLKANLKEVSKTSK